MLRFLVLLLLTGSAFADQLVIGVGAKSNDGSGDPVRTAFQKANTNFTAVFLNITTVSNSVGTVAANLTTVSNNVGVVAANLTTVSNSVGTVAGNLTTVSNSVTSVSANVSAVAANLTTVSNSVGAVTANLTTVSNQVVVDVANLTTVSNSVVVNTANLTTVSNSVVVNTANLTTVSNNVTAVTATAAPLIPANSLSGGTLVHNGTGWVTLPRTTANNYFLSSGTSGITNNWIYLPSATVGTATSDSTAGNSTNEVTLLGGFAPTKTISTTQIAVVGRTTRINVRGMVSNYTGLPTLTIRFKLSGSTYLTGTLAMMNATNNDFEIDILMTIRSVGAGGTMSAVGYMTHGMTTGTGGHLSLVFAGTQIIDTSTAKTVDVTAQWSVAHTSNTMTSQVATITSIYP